MQYIIPHYYKKFACIGGDCPDTCCAGWWKRAWLSGCGV